MKLHYNHEHVPASAACIFHPLMMLTLFLWCALTIHAGPRDKTVVWDNPICRYDVMADGHYNAFLKITRVEMKRDETVVYMQCNYLPGYWVKFVSDTYLRVGRQRYGVRSSTGIDLDSLHYMPASGKDNFIFRFGPLPRDTRSFDFIEGDGQGAFHLLGIADRKTAGQQLFPSNWRNEATGNWEIGFFEDCAVYDARFYHYKQKEQHGDKYHIVLTDSRKELTVEVGKMRDGRRTIAVDGGKPAVCGVLTDPVLPQYPIADDTPMTDTRCQTIDSVTIVGWLRNLPEVAKTGSMNFAVTVPGSIQTKELTYYSKIDSLGRFSLTFPLLNTTETFLRWDEAMMAMVLEPGKSYFLFFDVETGQRMVMGDDARMQNELFSSDFPYRPAQRQEGEDITTYWQKAKESRLKNEQLFKDKIEKNPLLSAKTKHYLKQQILTDMAREIGQARFQRPDFRLPPEIWEEMRREVWPEVSRSAIISNTFDTFLMDFSGLLTPASYGVDIFEAIKLVPITVTAEEKQMAEELKRVIDAQNEECAKAADDAEKNKILDKYNSQYIDLWAWAETFFRQHSKEIDLAMTIKDIGFLRSALDSLHPEQHMRDLMMGRKYYHHITHRVAPLNDRLLQSARNDIHSPAILSLLLQENDKYAAIERGEVKHVASLRSNDELEGMSNGEAMLNKITEPYRGRYILLDVWGTWCAPCKEALSHAHELFEAMAPYNMVMMYLANNSPEESWKNVIKQYDLTGENCVHYNLPKPQQSAIENFLGVNSYPTYRLIDPEGRVLDLNIDARSLSTMTNLMQRLTGK